MCVKATVLIVDDDPHIIRMLQVKLNQMGYTVKSASSGEQALRLVMEISPDIILLDLMMPGMDGFEVTRVLKEDEVTRIIPIVIISAMGEVKHRVQALEMGADDFLTKPVDTAELRSRVRSLLKVKAYNDHMRTCQQKLELEVASRTEELQQTHLKLKTSSLDVIFRLARAAEQKDAGTGAHIMRMSYYAVAIARKLGLAKAALDSILYASPMHDVGKIGIPDQILLKPGKLEPWEWETMKQHTTIGAHIVGGSGSEFIQMAEVIALSHHERWDGNGYPRGLSGNSIPQAARITSVADVFDALITDRPYRKDPFSADYAFAYILKNRGSHFDPEAVDAFLAISDEILTIRQKYVGEVLLP